MSPSHASLTLRIRAPSIQTYPMSAQTPANTGTVLDRILDSRRAAVEHRKKVLPETALKYGVAAATPLRNFPASLTRDTLNVIAELKPASPSRGVIRDPFDHVALAHALSANGAAALSVLTEPEFFGGTLKNMRDARKEITQPVLRKDFIFDPWQVWESRANDADSFLLIVAALRDPALKELIDLGRELKMEPLVEVHTQAELDRALAAVAESGLKDKADLVRLRAAGFDAFLIGESLMSAPDPGAALTQLLGTARTQS